MEEETTVENLFRRLSEEKKTGELLPLPFDFYKQDREEEKKTGEEKQKENRLRILNMLRARRVQKILIHLAYGRQPPKPIPKEEEKLYLTIKKILDEESNNGKIIKIKIKSKIPEIITPRGVKLGPYQENEIVETENDADVEFIINNGIGETIK